MTNGKRGAPVGNQNAARAKKFQEALMRALSRVGKNVDGGLNKVCDRLVKAAIDGESWAIIAIRDSIDGKPAQAMTLSGDENNPIQTITRTIVKPNHSDG